MKVLKNRLATASKALNKNMHYTRQKRFSIASPSLRYFEIISPSLEVTLH
jgi:hypothetical protein